MEFKGKEENQREHHLLEDERWGLHLTSEKLHKIS